MKSEELEAKLTALAEKVEKLEARITTAEDIEAIKKLHRAYGYYLEHWQEDEIVELFSHSSDVSVEINDTGLYKGWEAIRESYRFADHYNAYGGVKKAPPEYLHILMPIAGIVDVDPNGKTARGRWYGFGCLAIPEPQKVSAVWSVGCYENEYVKEDGKWKFRKILWNSIFRTPYEDGWVKTPKVEVDSSNKSWGAPSSRDKSYPSGYIFPYHYKNPVTGK